MKKHVLSVLVTVALLITIFTMQAVPVQAIGDLSTTDLNSLIPENLVNSLIGAGVIVSNITYTGVNIAAGTFSGGTGIIGFDEGIILSSGDIANVVGLNLSDSITQINNQPGDAALNGLIPGYISYDAAVLEFDFVPVGNVITFDYVFGSDEYNEYVNSSYNDVFGFFVNGANLALIPGTSTPVSINNVNGGNPYGTNTSNPGYYLNNDLDDGGGSINTELDGLTVVLTLTAKVNAGVTNHIKLAIADAGDHSLDSDVFIRAGSLVSSSIIAIVKTTNGQNVAGPPGPSIAVGTTVTWTYSVTNTGDVPLSNISVSDSVVGVNPAYVSGDTDPANGKLDLTETWIFEAQGTAVTGQYYNTGTAQSAPLGAVPITATDDSWYFGSGNGPDPDPEVGGDVYPPNTLVILTPWIVLAIVIAVGTTISIRRRHIQS